MAVNVEQRCTNGGWLVNTATPHFTGCNMTSYRSAVQKWYSSRRWKAKRLTQLQAEPLCAFCLRDGKVTPARIADHIKPHKGNEGLFWHGHLQSLCKACHDSEKALIEAGKAPVTHGLDGWPMTGEGEGLKV